MDRDYGARFTIDELVDSTGVQPRRIRYYIQQGLVSPAAGRGRSSYYTRTHVEELEKIRELQQRNLSHDEIRDALKPARTNDQELDGEIWKRVILHPDRELHLRSGAPEHVEALVLQLREIADRWIGPESDG